MFFKNIFDLRNLRKVKVGFLGSTEFLKKKKKKKIWIFEINEINE